MKSFTDADIRKTYGDLTHPVILEIMPSTNKDQVMVHMAQERTFKLENGQETNDGLKLTQGWVGTDTLTKIVRLITPVATKNIPAFEETFGSFQEGTILEGYSLQVVENTTPRTGVKTDGSLWVQEPKKFSNPQSPYAGETMLHNGNPLFSHVTFQSNAQLKDKLVTPDQLIKEEINTEAKASVTVEDDKF